MKTELLAGRKKITPGSKGYDLQVLCQCEVCFWKWTAALKRSKQTWLVKETNLFSGAQVKTKSCQNLFRKNNNRIEFTTHPWASSKSVSSAGVALANSYQSIWHASPSTSCGEIRYWRMTDMLSLKRDSTKFNPASLVERSLYSSASIWTWRAIIGDW